MNLACATTRAVLALAVCAVSAQTTLPPKDPAIPPDVVVKRVKPHVPRTPEPLLNANLVVLDPAHGGTDDGAHFTNGLLEKDLTVAFAARLRTALESRGFTVTLTHDTAADTLPFDNRVETANRSRAVACLILHASNGGQGVHLFQSAMPAAGVVEADATGVRPIQPWDTAQQAVVAQSTRLLADLATGLNGIRVPLVTSRASVRPIDALNCPAVVLELASLDAGEAHTSVADENYQQRVAEATASALALWRSHALAMAMSAQIAHEAETAKKAADAESKSSAEHPGKKPPKAKVAAPQKSFPDETPAGATPIVRRPPPTAPGTSPPGDQAR